MNLFSDIWQSFLSLPTWVKIWMLLILIPVNAASAWFIGNPWSWLIAALAFAGMIPNIFIVISDRSFTNRMAVPHVVFWIPLVLILAYLLLLSDVTLPSAYGVYLKLLLVINIISLGFDIPETRAWLRTRGTPS
jgi:hypothetical protein